jgi:hypothetical protein
MLAAWRVLRLFKTHALPLLSLAPVMTIHHHGKPEGAPMRNRLCDMHR